MIINAFLNLFFKPINTNPINIISTEHKCGLCGTQASEYSIGDGQFYIYCEDKCCENYTLANYPTRYWDDKYQSDVLRAKQLANQDKVMNNMIWLYKNPVVESDKNMAMEKYNYFNSIRNIKFPEFEKMIGEEK